MYYKSLYYTWFINNNLNVPQVAQQLQARLNVQMSISEDLQRKFNDISNAPEDDSDNATVTSPARKRRRTDNPDDNDLEEAEKDEVKRLGHRFVIMHSECQGYGNPQGYIAGVRRGRGRGMIFETPGIPLPLWGGIRV